MISRLIQYYFVVVLVLFSLILTADFWFQRHNESDKPHGMTQSLHLLLELAQHHCATVDCDASTTFSSTQLRLLERANFVLPQSYSTRFSQQQPLVVSDKSELYFYYPFSPRYVLEIGPLLVDEPTYWRWYSVLFYVVLGVAFLLILWPLYRDIWRIKEATEQFAQSKDLDNLAVPSSRFFKPVTDTINWMLHKIAKLMALQKELSGTLSHELRTNLSRLKFTLATLNEDNLDKSKVLLKQDVVEIEALIEQYLNFSKAEHEQPQLEIKEHRLSATINGYLEQLSTYSHKDYVFSVADDPVVKVDLPFLSRAIKNLIDNAFKYADSQIKLTLVIKQQHLVLRVEDDGSGVNAQEIDELFLPYTRHNNTQLGYGLGLAITKKVIHWHGGDIHVRESDTLGGACFEMRIPTA
ncbi:sensor histidine kinase [Pseudoalteromonas sp. SSDWG2]|uniref:sensor histidine kinase n=1 Tax=Pseudoalteromonas sp. SSDWG2 TaxID=3139391 RepID=UPI003BACB738